MDAGQIAAQIAAQARNLAAVEHRMILGQLNVEDYRALQRTAGLRVDALLEKLHAVSS